MNLKPSDGARLTLTSLFPLLAALLAAPASHAAPFTWDGGASGYWLTDANWNPDGKPDTDGSATLTFAGTARTTTTNDFPADTAFAGITLGNDNSSGKTAAFTLSGNRIILNGNIATTLLTANGTLADTISLPILLSGTRTITLNQASSKLHNLTISGVIGETGGSWGLTKNGGGALTLSGANTYSGKTTLTGDSVYFNTLKNVGGGASALGAPATVADGTIDISGRHYYNGASTSSDRILNLTGATTLDIPNSATVLTLSGGITGANQNFTARSGGSITVTGPVTTGSGTVGRTDAGTLTLSNPNNTFAGNITVSHGVISVNSISDAGSPSAAGQGSAIYLGQTAWDTTGRFQFTGPAGGACNRSITVNTKLGVYGGILENTVAGQTLSFGGNVNASIGTSGLAPLWLQGAGDGELRGVISQPLRVSMTGTGTWTLSGANVHTGATSVSSGTLLVNGSTAAGSAVTVGAAGAFGGTGTVYGAVSAVAGGTLVPGSRGIGTLTLADPGAAALALNGNTLVSELSSTAGRCDRIDVAGTLVLNGANTLALSFPDGFAAPGVYTQMTYAARSGSGSLTLDAPYPNTTLDVGETAVTVTVSGGGTAAALVWVGDGSANAWDTTSANWTPIPFSDGAKVTFDDTGSASPAVTITPSPVAPHTVTVNTTAKSYTIGGAGIAGTGSLTKSGNSTLTLSGPNTYSGATLVSGGTLTLSGSLSNSSVSVANKATLTQQAVGVIAGATATVTSLGTATLAGTNSYGGATTIGAGGISNIVLYANNSRALGSTAGGTVVIGGTPLNFDNKLVLGANVTVTGETLTLSSATGRAALRYNSGGTAQWDGDILMTGGANYLGSDNSGGTLVIGASADDTVTGVNQGVSIRGAGTVIINSTLHLGTGVLMRDDPGTLLLNTATTNIGSTSVVQGTLKLGVAEALPAHRPLSVGKSAAGADATIDLNGFTQTVAGLADQHYASGTGKQRILSATPATLVVSNSSDNTFGLVGSTIEGQVALVKAGTATLTLNGTNTASGAVTVHGGTLALSASGTLGASTNITVTAGTLSLQTSGGIDDEATLSIADDGGAKLALASGVNEAVARLVLGDRPKRAGTYGATGSGAQFISDTHFSGSGLLTVLHGSGGSILTLK